MSSVKIEGNASGTGIFTIASPNSNTNRTLTLPDVTGTFNTSGGVNEVPAGSASAPAIYPTGDTNTGVFFPAADTAAISTGGSERMRVASNGRVSIGTTSAPYDGLTIYSTADAYIHCITDDSGTTGSDGLTIGLGNDNAAYVFNRENSNLTFGTNGTIRAIITNDGSFKIAQTAGKYTIDVTDGATSIANNGTADFSAASGMLVVNNYSNGGVTLYLCGAGQTVAVSSIVGQVGTFTYVAGIDGYRFTNNYGSTATFGFFFVRTRPGA